MNIKNNLSPLEFRNKYLVAYEVATEESVILFRVKTLKPIPEFFLDPILGLASMLLAAQIDFALCDLEDLSLERCFISVGFSKEVFSCGDVLKIDPEKFHHQISYMAREYFEFSSRQEQFYLGLSVSDWRASNDAVAPDSFLEKKEIDRKFTLFEDLLKLRVSSSNFGGRPQVTQEQLNAILADCYYFDSKGKSPTANAGGFANFGIYFVTDGGKDFSKGIYQISSRSRAWIKTSDDILTRGIWEASFSQSLFYECQNYFVIVIDLEKMSEKYGSRSHRFSFLGLGGLLDRMHLSSTSYGGEFRILGGFDENLVKTLLGLDNPYLVVGAIVGIG